MPHHECMSVDEGVGPGRLKFLLDSNVVIAVEPYAGVVEPSAVVAARLVRLANEQGHLLCVAQATRDDLSEGSDRERRAQRLVELGKFHLLQEVPLEAALVDLAGASDPGTNDHRDLRILATLRAGAATHLVTEDGRLRRRAARAGLGDAVLSLAEAAGLLASFAPTEVTPPPRVTRIPTYAIDSEESIFDGLREDYPEFGEWLGKVRRESDQRVCFVIRDGEGYAAVAILKRETDCEYALSKPVTKICTFKVSPAYAGVKYGELLLKAVLQYAALSETATLYVEVLPSHPEVLESLSDFGFREHLARSGRGELVMVKELVPGPDADDLSDLEFHVQYGPPALRGSQGMYIVPIQPRWHDQLFPEQAPGLGAAQQLSLFPEVDPPLTHPWGNALRKAYLCNSATKSIRPGDLLLFYRSHDVKGVTAVGVVEAALRSTDPREVMTFVGRRTVYTPDEIAVMCRGVRGLLALRFRQDRFVEPPWQLTELRVAGVLNSWPQSICELSEVGSQWVRDRLDE